jgi:CDP-diacylglycerol--glycerol-3-phosphate 3-phosphatidyltransferase
MTANKITALRLFASPVFCLVYFLPNLVHGTEALSAYILVPLIVLAEFTDYLDGAYARKRNEVSDFGKLFDPFADMVLHLGVFVCLTFTGYMPVFLFLLVIYREFCMSFVRMLAARQGTAIAARAGGKTKTVLYIAFIFVSVFRECAFRTGLDLPGSYGLLDVITLALAILAVLAAYISFADYLVNFRKALTFSAGHK